MTESVTYRAATVEDAPQVAQLLIDIGWFSGLKGKSHNEIAQIVQTHLANGSDSTSTTVAVIDGVVHGYTNTHWLHDLFMPAPEGYVSEVFVSPSHQGQGIGTHLLELIATEGKKRGAFRLSLINGKHRDSYQRNFYQKHGWEERELMANFVFWLADK